jgi:hypothetical protein
MSLHGTDCDKVNSGYFFVSSPFCNMTENLHFFQGQQTRLFFLQVLPLDAMVVNQQPGY